MLISWNQYCNILLPIYVIIAIINALPQFLEIVCFKYIVTHSSRKIQLILDNTLIYFTLCAIQYIYVINYNNKKLSFVTIGVFLSLLLLSIYARRGGNISNSLPKYSVSALHFFALFFCKKPKFTRAHKNNSC